MPAGSLADPLARLERADEHVAQLRRAAREYLDAQPYEIYDEQIGPDTRVLRVRIRQPPPRRLCARCGKAGADVVRPAEWTCAETRCATGARTARKLPAVGDSEAAH